MAFTVIQAGTSLQGLTTTGALTTLTLPSGVTLNATLRPRFAIFNKYTVMVNSPSRPIIISGDGVVRVLSPTPPQVILSLAGVAGGTLSGTYKARQTFIVFDTNGDIITQSDYGPVMTIPVTIAANYLQAQGLDISTDAVSGSRLYRTATGGSVYFQWIDQDGNTQTSGPIDALSDAGLGLVAGPILGAAPDLTLICEWRGRLWGVSRLEIDHLRYTETGLMYAWPILNDVVVPRLGADTRGVTGLVARRDALGIGRRNSLHQMTGDSASSFRLVKISEAVGVESNESIVVYRDVAYWLWKDGVYQWDSNGVTCVSDGTAGRAMVRSWFTTDSYFNRARFQYAFAQIDPVRNKYRLFLASAGSSVEDRWVEFDLNDRTWWGPHKTGAFSPTCTLIVPDANDTLVQMVGSSSAYLWKEQATRTDSTATAIDYDVDAKRHDAKTPDIEKNWLQLSLLSKVQAAGSMSVTPYVGPLSAAAGTAITADMTKGREKLPRLGAGKFCGLNFRHNTVAQDCELYGYELPFYELGRR